MDAGLTSLAGLTAWNLYMMNIYLTTHLYLQLYQVLRQSTSHKNSGIIFSHYQLLLSLQSPDQLKSAFPILQNLLSLQRGSYVDM